jgi:hypothetical protein
MTVLPLEAALPKSAKIEVIYYEVKKGGISTSNSKRRGLCGYSMGISSEKYWGPIGLKRFLVREV